MMSATSICGMEVNYNKVITVVMLNTAAGPVLLGSCGDYQSIHPEPSK